MRDIEGVRPHYMHVPITKEGQLQKHVPYRQKS
jgi:hypothetical protein